MASYHFCSHACTLVLMGRLCIARAWGGYLKVEAGCFVGLTEDAEEAARNTKQAGGWYG